MQAANGEAAAPSATGAAFPTGFSLAPLHHLPRRADCQWDGARTAGLVPIVGRPACDAPESVCDAAVAELPTSAPGPAASAPEPVGSKVELADPHGISLSFEVDGPSPSEESALRHRANGTHAPLLQNSSAVPSATHETRTTRAKYSSSTVVPEPITRTPARLEGYSDSLRPSPGRVAGTAAAISAAEGRARIVAQARAGLQQRSQGTPLRQPIDDPRTAEIGRYM